MPEVDGTAVAPLPGAFWHIRARVVDLLGLHGLEEDHYQVAFLTYITEGGAVQEHRDDRVYVDGIEYLNLRCNVLFQRPGEGGYSVIAGAELDIPEGGMWAFCASELAHSAGRVRGPGPRGTLSFGFLVEAEKLLQRRFEHAGTDPRQGVRVLELLAAEPDGLSAAEAAAPSTSAPRRRRRRWRGCSTRGSPTAARARPTA